MLEHEITHKGHTIAFKRCIIDPDDSPIRGWELWIDGQCTGSQFASLESWVIAEAKRQAERYPKRK